MCDYVINLHNVVSCKTAVVGRSILVIESCVMGKALTKLHGH